MGHNYLGALPFIAIVAGVGAIRMIDAVSGLRSEMAGRGGHWIWVGGGGVFLLVCLLVPTPLVVSDSPSQLLPLVTVPPALLVQNGYRAILRTEHFVVWALSPAP
jgi:hypothetical protein